MEEVLWDQTEIACICKLADLYEKGVFQNGTAFQTDPVKCLGLSDEKWDVVLTKLEHYGAIVEAYHGDDHHGHSRFFRFIISPKVVQLARKEQARKQQPEDIVEQVKATAKRNPVVAWAIIVFTVLTIAAAFVASILTIIDKLIDLHKKLEG